MVGCIWADYWGSGGTGLGPVWAELVPRTCWLLDHMLILIYVCHKYWHLANSISQCQASAVPFPLVWNWTCMSKRYFQRCLSLDISSGHWGCSGCFLGGLTPGQQWASHLGSLAQFRIHIHFPACAIEIYFLCKRLESQSKIPPAGLEYACSDPNGERFWFIFLTACTLWSPWNPTLLRVCHHNTSRKLRQFGCPWAPN